MLPMPSQSDRGSAVQAGNFEIASSHVVGAEMTPPNPPPRSCPLQGVPKGTKTFREFYDYTNKRRRTDYAAEG